MSFPEPFAGRGRRCDPDQEGKRQVPLYLDNAAFSQLIKASQKDGKTPARWAQALFEEAFAAKHAGKSLPAGDATPSPFPACMGVGDGSGELFVHGSSEAIRAARAIVTRLEELAVQLVAMTASRDEHLAGRDRALDKWNETQDLLVAARDERDEARRERDELSRRCWNAEAQLEQLRAAPAPLLVEPATPLSAAELAPLPIVEPAPTDEPIVTAAQFLPCEDHEANGNLPAEPEPAPVLIGKSTVKAVLMLRGMNETPAEIAKNLALRREIVDQVLRENRA